MGLKSNSMQQLQEIDKKYQGTPIGYGKGSLTYPGSDSANRLWYGCSPSCSIYLFGRPKTTHFGNWG